MTFRQCSSEHDAAELGQIAVRCLLGANHAGQHHWSHSWPETHVAVSWPNTAPKPKRSVVRTPKPTEQLDGQLSIYDALGDAG